MRFEPRHAFLASRHHDKGLAREDIDLPPEIAFLALRVDRAVLRAAVRRAHQEQVCAARALIAYGGVNAGLYYRALADHLGLPFVADWPRIAPVADPAAAHRTGRVALAAASPAHWLVAPEDAALRALVRDGIDAPNLAITTPAHLAALIHYRGQATIEREASEALPNKAPRLSARGAVDLRVATLATLLLACGLTGNFYAPGLVGDLLGLLFFAGMVFRLMVGIFGLATPPEAARAALSDADLPTYTVLVPLHREAEIVPDLLAALAAIDYPRTKLQVLVIVEPEDRATRDALASAHLSPWLHVVLGPIGGALRTKPRALNIGLTMTRGTLLTVYDAEDRPAPDQLRRAAALFEAEGEDLACVQACLAIDNGTTSWLARLFAIEYAALFDVFNVGAAGLRLPMALGGTSNHFKVSALRAAGGWDAWNVTEDADLGLRLARLDYRVGSLASTTLEAAPEFITIWMKQRRRWTKGWMQTCVVLLRDGPCVLRRLGWFKSTALALLLVNLVAGPLLFPVFCGFVAHDLFAFGIPTPHGTFHTLEATLSASVFAIGLASPLWHGYTGLRARELLRFFPSLPLLLPYQLMISAAAWMGLLDLIFAPYHWHKTVHRPAGLFNAAPRGVRPCLRSHRPAR